MMVAATIAMLGLTQQFPTHSKAELTLASPTVIPGATVEANLRVSLDSGWHSYWVNPGENGSPPEFKFSLPTGWKILRTRYELPEMVIAGEMVSYGYEDHFNVRYTLQAPKQVGKGQIAGKLEFLVCQETCIPQSLSVAVPVTVGAESAPKKALPEASFPEWDPAVKAEARVSGSDLELRITGLKTDGLDLPGIQLFSESPNIVNYASRTDVRTSNGALIVRIPKSPYWDAKTKSFRALIVAPENQYWSAKVRGLVLNVPVRS